MPKQPDTFAARLKSLRLAAGVSQSELARRAGLAQSTVLRLEAGDRGPGWDVVQALAAALEVSVEAFRTDRPSA